MGKRKERRASSVERREGSVEQGASSVERQASSVEQGASSVERGASRGERQASSVERREGKVPVFPRLSSLDACLSSSSSLVSRRSTLSSLRVIDFGEVSPLRSQTLWHAIAEGVSEGAPSTLSFMRPSDPYVSIGYHRTLDELDLDFCRAAGLPVFRRRVGGGPVYLDRDQFFFQITVPVGSVSPMRSQALTDLLAPAVEAYRNSGIPDATLDAAGEIVVGEAKICGHAAGQIGRAVVVVGNLITAFDHSAATGILAAPHAEARDMVHRTMRQHVAAHDADPVRFRRAAEAAYGEALGLSPTPGALTEAELEHLTRYDEEFVADDWMSGPVRPPPPVWKVKIRAGVEVIGGANGASRAAAVIRGGAVSEATLVDPALNGRAHQLEEHLRGLTLEDAHHLLTTNGTAGRRLAASLGAKPRSHP